MGKMLLIIGDKPTIFTRYMARGISIFVVIVMLVLLNQTPSLQLHFVRDEQIANVTVIKPKEIPIPKPKILPPEKLKKQAQTPIAAPIPDIRDRVPKTLNLPNIAAPSQPQPMPNIATNTTAPSPAPAQAAPPARSALQRALWLQACERIDAAERPPDCPITDRARRAVAAASEPKYNPDRVRSYSRAEINAKKSAGWRDRCETNDGRQAQVCIAIGRTPTQVKTPYEICMEHGLSNCHPPPSKYDDPILGFGNQE